MFFRRQRYFICMCICVTLLCVFHLSLYKAQPLWCIMPYYSSFWLPESLSHCKANRLFILMHSCLGPGLYSLSSIHLAGPQLCIKAAGDMEAVQRGKKVTLRSVGWLDEWKWPIKDSEWGIDLFSFLPQFNTCNREVVTLWLVPPVSFQFIRYC